MTAKPNGYRQSTVIAGAKAIETVIRRDDEIRENGVIMIVAKCATVGNINFVAKPGGALIWLALTRRRTVTG